MKLRFALLTVVILLALTSTAHAAIYWSTSFGIARANNDGSMFDWKFVDNVNACGVAVDSRYIYWTNNYTNTIGRAKLNGADVEEEFMPNVGTGPCGIAVNSQYIYWTNWHGFSIGRANLDGSNVHAAFVPGADRPCGLAITDLHIYWGNWGDGTIMRTSITGLGGTKVVYADGSDPCGIALDESYVYWADMGARAIGRASLSGADPLPNFIPQAEYPSGVAIHGGYLYWINRYTTDAEAVGRADLNGANINQRFLPSFHSPWAIAVDSRKITPPPPLPKGNFRIGRIKRNTRRGIVYLAVDFFGRGFFSADVEGARLEILPDRIVSPVVVGAAGRKWLKISPTLKARGSKRVRNELRRHGFANVVLRGMFSEHGKSVVRKGKKLKLVREPKSRRVQQQ